MDNLSNTERPICNLKASLKRLGGNRQLLLELISIYLEDYQALLVQIKRTINSGDYSATSRFAHTLKGLASNFNCEIVTEIADSVCMATRSDSESEPKADLAALDCAANLLAQTLVEARCQLQAEAK